MAQRYKICTQCGSKVDADYNFCPNCKSQSFRNQPVRSSHSAPSNISQKLLYWEYDGNYVMSKAKVAGIVVFLLFLGAAIVSPYPGVGLILSVILGAVTYLVGYVIHSFKKPKDAQIEYNNYGVVPDLIHLFFFWQNKKTGDFVLSKTKIISFAFFVLATVGFTIDLGLAALFTNMMAAILLEIPVFCLGYAIHKFTNPNPVNPPKEIKPQKEPEKVKEVKRFKNIIRKPKKEVVERPSQFSEYERQVNELTEEFTEKDKAVRKLIEKRFEPPQITYTRFISLVDKCSEIFEKESEAALNIINLASEDSPRIDRELKSKISIMNSIIDKIDDLINELVLSMDSSKDDDVDGLIGDMEDLIGSIRDYE